MVVMRREMFLESSLPENRQTPKRKLIFQPSIFQGRALSFREGIVKDIDLELP